MSRGMGRIEQGLFNVIRNEGRPMSYADIAGVLMQAAGINDFKERRLSPGVNDRFGEPCTISSNAARSSSLTATKACDTSSTRRIS